MTCGTPRHGRIPSGPAVAAAAGLLLGLAACSSAEQSEGAPEENVVNVYNWADYIGDRTVAAFQREYGIKVNYDTYDSSEIVDARLMAGSTGYDVVFHSVQFAARLIPIGIFQPLDRSELPNWKNLDPKILEGYAFYDSRNRYAAPYMWGTDGFAYNVEMVRERLPDAPVDSGAMLFDPEIVQHFADCGVTFLDSPTDVFPMALIYLGYDPNTTDLEQNAEAEQMLHSVRPYIRYFDSTRMLLDLPNREVCIAMSWSGDYATARRRAEEAGIEIELAYSVPKEGSIDWRDAAYIPADASHPHNAHLFIDYLLRPDVIAEITNQVHYANANRAAVPLVAPQLLEDPAVYPSSDLLERIQPALPVPKELDRIWTRAWARIKTGT